MALAAGKSLPDSMTVREAAATVEGSPEARHRQIVELIQRFEGIARRMKVGSIGWGDMEPKDIMRLRAALEVTAWLAGNHLAGLPREFARDTELTDEEIKAQLGKLTNTLAPKSAQP